MRHFINSMPAENYSPADEYILLGDAPFLPKGYISIYDFVIGLTEAPKERKDIYYALVPVPDFYEIRPMGEVGGVYDMNVLKATIHFKHPADRGYVSALMWHDTKGGMRRIDNYDIYGNIYRIDDILENGSYRIRSYVNSKGLEVVTINDSNGTVTYYENGLPSHIFTNENEFFDFVIRENT